MMISMILVVSGFTSLSSEEIIPMKSRNIFKRDTCTRNSFVCNNRECIDHLSICDGVPDCSDKSDETRALCNVMKCPKYSFRCAYGACIDADKTCNMVVDCVDGSDELLKECPNSSTQATIISSGCTKFEFHCGNGECIDKSLVCDGLKHCGDGSDETIKECYQSGFICPVGSFRCGYGACVDGDARCDGKTDCYDDNSDEEGCPSSPSRPNTPVQETRPQRPVTVTRPPPAEIVTRPRPPITQTTVRAPPPTWATTKKPAMAPLVMPANSCPFPKNIPGTNFLLGTCNCKSQFVPPNEVVLMSCTPGYVPLYEDKSFAVCFRGRLDPEDQRCVRPCSKLTDTHSVIYKCMKDGTETECTGFERPGSVVKMKCRTGYSYPGNPRLRVVTGKCGADGFWSNVDDFDCTHDCGKLFKSPNPLISHGADVKNISEYPWHAGIYSWKNNIWNQDCGGTIITPFFILTAAHCVHVDGVRRIQSQLKVAVGKYFRKYDTYESSAARFNVSEIYVPDSFKGKKTYYENDVAIIEVEGPIELSNAVMPACISLPNDQPPDLNGRIGHIVGWGRDENQLNTETLKSANLPYISNSACSLYKEVEEYLARDKFCAFLTNGTGVLSGDSGGGLTFDIDGNHFVYGIVSVNIKTTVVSAFTDLTFAENKNFVNDRIIEFDKKLRLNNRNRG